MANSTPLLVVARGGEVPYDFTELSLNESLFRPILQTWKLEQSGFQFVLQSKQKE